MTTQRIILLLALGLPALAAAEEDGMTLQQERDRIGAEMEESRRQGGQDLNAIRNGDTGRMPTGVEQPGTFSPGTPTGNNGPLIDRVPRNGSGGNGTAVTPGNQNAPISTTTPGASTVEPGRPTTTGTPTSPVAPNNGAEGNAGGVNRGGSGGNGTVGGNGGAAAGGR